MTTPAQDECIRNAASRLSVEPIDFYTVLDLETAGTFDPSICNYTLNGVHRSARLENVPDGARVVAVGLIQWTLATLLDMRRYCSTSPGSFKELAALSFEQQIDLAVAYLEHQLKPYPGERSLDSLYLAIFWPSAIPYPDTAILTSDPARAYRLNRGFDRNRDGIIKRGEVVWTIRARKQRILDSGKWVPCWEKNPPECVV